MMVGLNAGIIGRVRQRQEGNVEMIGDGYRTAGAAGIRAVAGLMIIALVACATPTLEDSEPVSEPHMYRIGVGDTLDIFVWDNPELSVSVPVRPDGRISTPLVEDVMASGRTPAELAREMEQRLSKYVRRPTVTIIVTQIVGRTTEQVRVVGQATNPQAIPYREDMTLLDVMIEVGGLTEFASGNSAYLVRTSNGTQRRYRVRLDDLVNDGDMSANVRMEPGDVIIIPEAWF